MRRLFVVMVGFCACITFETTRDGASLSLSEVPNSKLVLGEACSTADECGSGFCTDGVCCNDSCEGECARCDGDTPGTCQATVTPSPTRAACAANKTACSAHCDGVSRRCSYPDDSIHCGAACAGTCNGAGACSIAGGCAGGFACVGASCANVCQTNADCFANFECASPPNCTRIPEHDCLDGLDDNGDGLADCEDPTCFGDEVECIEDPADASAIGYLSDDTACAEGYSPTTLTGEPGPNTGACGGGCICTPPATTHDVGFTHYTGDGSCGASPTAHTAVTISSAASFRTCIYSNGSGFTATSLLPTPQGSDTLAATCNSTNLSGTATPPPPAWGKTRAFCGVTKKSGTCPSGQSCVARQAKKHCALFNSATSCSSAYSASTTWFSDFGADTRTCTACNTLGCTATPKTLSGLELLPQDSTCTNGVGSQYVATPISSIGIDWPTAGSCHTSGAPEACSHSSCWSGSGTTIKALVATSSWSGGSCTTNTPPTIAGGALAGSGASTTCCEP